MRTIVGVVEDVKWERVTDEPKGALYVPLSQGAPGPMRLIVRTAADPGATFEHVRSTVRSLDGDTPVDQMGPLADLVAASVEQPRFAASLLSGFAFAGLLLGAIGIYGTISDHVTERRREIGVRMALGAQRRDVIRTVVGGTFLMVACGAGIGVAIAALVSRVFATLLFGISPGDVTTFVTAGIVLALTALAAAYGPARRAAAVDPLSALRD
jgi:putative ABC transport system permease protein